MWEMANKIGFSNQLVGYRFYKIDETKNSSLVRKCTFVSFLSFQYFPWPFIFASLEKEIDITSCFSGSVKDFLSGKVSKLCFASDGQIIFL